MSDPKAPGYGYTGQRPPMPSPFIPAPAITPSPQQVPESQMPSIVAQVVSDTKAIPSFLSGEPTLAGVVVDNTAVAHTGDTNTAELKSLMVPQNTLPTNGGIRLLVSGSCSGTANSKTLVLRWVGKTIATLAIASGTTAWRVEAEIWNRGSSTSQVCAIRMWDQLALEQNVVTTASGNTG